MLLKKDSCWYTGALSATMTNFAMIHFTPICFETTAEAFISNKGTIHNGTAVGEYEIGNSRTAFSSVINFVLS